MLTRQAVSDLLEVCEELCDMLDEAHAGDKAADHGGDESCSYCETLDRARAMIAKVRGGVA